MELRDCDIPNPVLWARAGIFALRAQERNSRCVPWTGWGWGQGSGRARGRTDVKRTGTTRRSGLHVDVEGDEKFRGHDVEPDCQMKFDERFG